VAEHPLQHLGRAGHVSRFGHLGIDLGQSHPGRSTGVELSAGPIGFEPWWTKETAEAQNGHVRHGMIRGDAALPHGRGSVRRGGARLRRRVLISIVSVTAGAVLVFSLPLGWALAQVYRGEAVAVLQRDTTWAAADLGVKSALDPAAVEGFDELSPGVDVGLYTLVGRRISGEGPSTSQLAEQAGDGALHQAVETGHLAVVAPVVRGGRVVATLRVWMPWDQVTDRWMQVWLLLAALGTAVVALSALVAWQLARRMATPLERLTVIAGALGDGDFTIRAPYTGIREVDTAGQALEATARRLGQVLKQERSFTTAVSHQLRTPLTALVLGLEAAQTAGERARREAVATALRRAEHLKESVDELMRLARETHRGDLAVDAAAVAERVARRHRAAVAEAGRGLVVRCEPDLAPVRVSEAAIAQILGTLLENALVHGRGEIRLTVSDLGTGVSIEVGDDGPGLASDDEQPVFAQRSSGAGRHGLGLPLARSLAEAEGGRLVIRRSGPRPVFSLLLPIQDRPEDASGPADVSDAADGADAVEDESADGSQR
jgi:signal transduction histidine kinase